MRIQPSTVRIRGAAVRIQPSTVRLYHALQGRRAAWADCCQRIWGAD